MRKLYGNQIRKEAGLTKTLKSAAIALPKRIPDRLQQEIGKIIRENQDSTKSIERLIKDTVEKVEKAVEETKGAVGDMMFAAQPRLQSVIEETRQLLEGSRLPVPLKPTDIYMHNLSRYSLQVHQDAFEVGQPIQVEWKAPENHGSQDWIGIFRLGDNKSRQVTSINSRGLWHWINAGTDADSQETIFPPEIPIQTQGKIEFNGNRLPWKVGTYEFRYHHDNKHDVLAISAPFEIKVPAVNCLDIETIQMTVLKFIQNTLGNNQDIMPHTPQEEFVGMRETECKHLVDCIEIAYNVEFAWEVVLADKCATRLAKRVNNILISLAYHLL